MKKNSTPYYSEPHLRVILGKNDEVDYPTHKLQQRKMKNTYDKSRRRFIQGMGAALAYFAVADRKSEASNLFSRKQRVYYVHPKGNDSNRGTIDRPWATIQKAADTLEAGDTVYIRGGMYSIEEQIRPKNSGQTGNWITYAAYPEETVAIDAKNVPVGPPVGEPPFPRDEGAFQIEGKSYIRVKNLKLMNSHNSGFTVRDSHHVTLSNNTTTNTFAPGIGVWGGHNHKVIGNTITGANRLDMLIIHEGYPYNRNQAPHEAISIGSSKYFEVAYNHVCHSEKEGIDCKGTCAHGTVHHNYVHHVGRQGLYVDSWAGILEDIQMYENIVHDCDHGIAISAEDGPQLDNIAIHHNLIYNNRGAGIFLSRWGKDRRKTNIKIYNNTIHHNGYGTGDCEQPYWLTGGLYLYSTNLDNVEIKHNIFSENKYFQIGYSGNYTEADFQSKNINIKSNLIFDRELVNYPVHLEEWASDYVYAANGDNFVEGDPKFVNPKIGNFYLQSNSPAINAGSSDGTPNDLGAFEAGKEQTFWWWSYNF